MSDTPRTDSVEINTAQGPTIPHLVVTSDFARELERENAALRVDKERLDSGTIRIVHRDEFGEPAPCIHTGIDIRAAIDAAREGGAS